MKLANAAFVAAYGASAGDGMSELTDELPMIDDPLAMCGSAALAQMEHRRDVGLERVVPLLVRDFLQ